MGNFCMIYIQLFTGWMLLNLATLSLTLIPHSALFFDLSDDVDDEHQVWTFGMWVVVEITLFFTLLIMATVLMCACQNVPQESGFVHLLVDPSIVTLGCVPFLLITGLPRANYIENCIRNTTVYDLHPQLVNVTDQFHPAFGEIPLPRRYAPITILSPTDCLYSQFYWSANASQVAAIFGGNASSVEHVQSLLSKWKLAIETSLVLPVVLHLLHYHWKMSWQPFLQSNLYLLLQALDIVYFIDTSIFISNPSLKLCVETLIYISTLLLCVGCLTLATPPIYMGNSVSKDYLRVAMAMGTIVVDAINLIMRIAFIMTEKQFFDECNQPLFYILLVKNCMCVAGLLYYGLARAPCIKPEYNSLLTQDPDTEEIEKEDFV